MAVRKSWCSSDGVRRFGVAPPNRLPLSELSLRHWCVLRLTSKMRRLREPAESLLPRLALELETSPCLCYII